ncbi:hypothetical protein Tco_0312118 [Tanacetum coccineum]
MEDDYKPVVQMQRRVNPKIHEVIKKEVIKLLDAGLIYPISDSPWVSPVHCVPKKGGMTVVQNDDNELIPTRLVTGWRVCIDYRKLNDATRKDHFPLPFMDQMLERLAGNEFYCFLDGDCLGSFQIPIDPQRPRIDLLYLPLWEPLHYKKNAFWPFDFALGAQLHLHHTEKEMLAVVYALELFDLIIEFNLEIRDKKGAENVAADHLSRLENPHKNELERQNITESFPLESLGKVEEVKEINENVNVLSDNTTPWFSRFGKIHGSIYVEDKECQLISIDVISNSSLHKVGNTRDLVLLSN